VNKKLALPIALGLLLVAILIGGIAAAPNYAVVNQNLKVITVESATVLAADKTHSSYSWQSNTSGYDFEKADIFYVVAGATVTDTVDLTLETSPDGTIWTAHSASPVGSQMTTATTAYETVDVQGRFFRLKTDLASSGPATVTYKVVLR
jgi:hypothetical protein